MVSSIPLEILSVDVLLVYLTDCCTLSYGIRQQDRLSSVQVDCPDCVLAYQCQPRAVRPERPDLCVQSSLVALITSFEALPTQPVKISASTRSLRSQSRRESMCTSAAFPQAGKASRLISGERRLLIIEVELRSSIGVQEPHSGECCEVSCRGTGIASLKSTSPRMLNARVYWNSIVSCRLRGCCRRSLTISLNVDGGIRVAYVHHQRQSRLGSQYQSPLFFTQYMTTAMHCTEPQAQILTRGTRSACYLSSSLMGLTFHA